MTQSPLSHAQHLRATLRLGVPLIGGHVAQFLIGMTDSIMVGQYGVDELAALTLAGTLFFNILLLGSGFAWAIMPMVATYAARQDDTNTRRAVRMALWLSALFCVISGPLLWYSGALLRAIGQEPHIADMAQTYLRIAGWGLVPALGVMVLKSYLAGLEHTRVVLLITLAAAAVNVPANYALIFGEWGAPELGIAGAAIASLVVQMLSLALIIAYALRLLPQHEIFVRFWRLDLEMLRQVFRLGVPIGLTTLAEAGLFGASAVLIGLINTQTLAAHGAALHIASATFMVQMGLANAATVRAGTALGQHDPLHLRRGAHVVLVLGGLGVLASVALFLLIPNTLLGVFIDYDDPQRDQILAIGRQLLLLAALFQLVDAAQVIHIGLLRGLQDTRVPMIVAIISYWALGFVAAYVLGFPFGLGAVGVWLGLVLGLTAAATLLGWRFWRRGAQLLAAG